MNTKNSLPYVVQEFLLIAEEEVKSGEIMPEERYTPAMLVECFPLGTTLAQVYEALTSLGTSVKFSAENPEQIIELLPSKV